MTARAITPTGTRHHGQLRETLRQMLAVLESERQALAGLDLDGIVGATRDKERLCGTLGAAAPGVGGGMAGAFDLDEECRTMLDTARRLNEVNRQVRNLLAANVSRRLDALTGSPRLYHGGSGYAVAGVRA
ncbi:flagellar protein FlgN [Novosphingobium aureum]|nr:flagellar protein FlgN [Novosphingobium aureum]